MSSGKPDRGAGSGRARAGSGTLDERLVEPYPAIVIRAARAFAWIALAVGFSTVLRIIYAVVFACR